MRFLSLFAGIGGFDLGLERAGFECAGQVEINPFCQKVLAKHWPNVKRMSDIREVKGNEFGTIDLVCGGFPCQPFSVAGKQKGKEDDRYLWPEMLRIIKVTKPTWIVGENVVGIVNLALEQVCLDLEAEEYEVQSFIIPACAVDAPHRRDRVWIIAYSSSKRCSTRICDREERYILRNENRDASQDKSERNGRFDRSREVCSILPDTRRESERTEKNRPCAESIYSSSQREQSEEGNRPSDLREDVPNTNSERLQGSENGREFDCLRKNETEQSLRLSCSAWKVFPAQPALCGRNDGVSNRVDRVKSLGNAVVPQIVEIIGKAIKAGALHYSLQ